MQNHVKKHCWGSSSIGRKQLIGATGIGLSLFVLIHMAGNLLIFVSPQAYNEYSHKLTSNPAIYIAEAGLVVMFLCHLGLALRTSWMNFQARDTRYAVLPNGPKKTTAVQRSLWFQGLVLLFFTISHLLNFKYGPNYTVNYGQGEIRDLFQLVNNEFHETGEVIWYLVSLVVLGLHLSHGVGSSFQTLGIHHPRYQCGIKLFSWVYALIVSAGFIAVPVYIYFLS